MSKAATSKRAGRATGATNGRASGAGAAGRSRAGGKKSRAKSSTPRTPERWLGIPSFPDYEASSKGRIRRAVGAAGTREGRVLSPRLVNGYLRVDLRKKVEVRKRKQKKGKRFYVTVLTGESFNKGVAGLVAETFLRPCPEGKLVTHKDGNRTNNWPENLEYVTRSAATKARMPSRNSQAKLTPVNVRRIRRLYEDDGWSGADIARAYDISVSAALSAAQGKTWKEVV